MNLRETTRDIINQVEQQTGCSVQVIDDPDLSTTAVVHMARSAVPAHIIRYKPSATQPIDYLICYQCGFILRLFANPPDARFEIIGTDIGYQAVETALTQRLAGMSLSRQQLQPAAQTIYNGLIVHLRSVAVGLRVSAWLNKDYPELQQLQQTQVDSELKLNSESLQPQIRAMMPDIVFEPTQAINAAFANFWSWYYKRAAIMQPYVQAGYRKAGGDLLDIWNEVPSDPTHDSELIDRWAEAVKIRQWYQWIPYQSPN